MNKCVLLSLKYAHCNKVLEPWDDNGSEDMPSEILSAAGFPVGVKGDHTGLPPVLQHLPSSIVVGGGNDPLFD